MFNFFRVPWSGRYGFVHPCPAGCCGKLADGPCANPGKSIKRAQDLALRLFVPPISEPAANKYTNVDPCVKSVLLIAWAFGLLRKALGVRLRKAEDEESDLEPDHCDADAAIGVPRDDYAYHREMGHLKLQKIHRFLSHGCAKYMLLV